MTECFQESQISQVDGMFMSVRGKAKLCKFVDDWDKAKSKRHTGATLCCIMDKDPFNNNNSILFYTVLHYKFQDCLWCFTLTT